MVDAMAKTIRAGANVSVIKEKSPYDDLGEEKNWLTLGCVTCVLLFILCFALLFTLFSFVVYGSSRPYTW